MTTKLELFPSKENNLAKNYAWQIWALKFSGPKTEFRLLYSWIIPSSYPTIGWQDDTTDHIQNVIDEKGKTIRIELISTIYVGTGTNIRSGINTMINGSFLNETELPTTNKPLPNNFLNLSVLSSGNTNQASYIVRPEVMLPMEHMLIPWRSKSIPNPFHKLTAFVSQIFLLDKSKVFDISNHTFDQNAEKQFIKKTQEIFKRNSSLDITRSSAPRIGNIEWFRFPAATETLEPAIEFWCNKTDDEKSATSVTIHLSENKVAKDVLVKCRIYNGEEVTKDVVKQLNWHSLQEFIVETQEPISEIHVTVWEKIGSDDYSIIFDSYTIIVRTISFEMSMIGNTFKSDRINLLNKVNKEEKSKIADMASFSRSTNTGATHIGGHAQDPWVKVSREINSEMQIKFPERSQGRFFKNGWDAEAGESGQLSFYQWISKIVSGSSKSGLIFIDPFFDQDGIEIFARAETSNVSYRVLTCTQHRDSDDPSTSEKIPAAEKLRQVCLNTAILLRGLDFELNDLRSINGGKDQLFHDRYLLKTNGAGQVIAGFHLSNSLQGATRKAPLLVTPIPEDILPDVLRYVTQLLEPQSEQSKKVEIKSVYAPTQQSSRPNRKGFWDIEGLNGLYAVILDKPELSTADKDTLKTVLEENEIVFVTEDIENINLFNLSELHIKRLIAQLEVDEKFYELWSSFTEMQAYGHSRNFDEPDDSYNSWKFFKEAIFETNLKDKIFEYVISYKTDASIIDDRNRLFSVLKPDKFEETLDNTYTFLDYFPEFTSVPYNLHYSIKLAATVFPDNALQMLETLLNELDSLHWNEADPRARAKMQIVTEIASKFFDFGGRKNLKTIKILLKSTNEQIRAASAAALLSAMDINYIEPVSEEEVFELLKAELSDDEFRLCIAMLAERHRRVRTDSDTQTNFFARLVDNWDNASILDRVITVLCGRLTANNSDRITRLFLEPLVTADKITIEQAFEIWEKYFFEKVKYRDEYTHNGSSDDYKTFVINTDIELTKTLVRLFGRLEARNQQDYFTRWRAEADKMWSVLRQPFAFEIQFQKYDETATRICWLSILLKEVDISDEQLKSSITEFFEENGFEINNAYQYCQARKYNKLGDLLYSYRH